MDLKQISNLLELLAEHDVSEFRYEDETFNLRLRIGPQGVPVLQHSVAAPVAAAPAAAAAAAAPAVDSSLIAIESPMVGTYYSAPSPDASPYVAIGDRVSKGQTLCIVEAMKMMNEIESEVAGTVAEILNSDGQPVQFGQALFRIKPD